MPVELAHLWQTKMSLDIAKCPWMGVSKKCLIFWEPLVQTIKEAREKGISQYVWSDQRENEGPKKENKEMAKELGEKWVELVS